MAPVSHVKVCNIIGHLCIHDITASTTLEEVPGCVTAHAFRVCI